MYGRHNPTSLAGSICSKVEFLIYKNKYNLYAANGTVEIVRGALMKNNDSSFHSIWHLALASDAECIYLLPTNPDYVW